ncbi:hypothetical protein HDV03_004124 [Kappamyces sp. JEL0829]|nr:hypothetical protein HDV03_004124 [Kappamyces sp. JEL0829]
MANSKKKSLTEIDGGSSRSLRFSDYTLSKREGQTASNPTSPLQSPKLSHRIHLDIAKRRSDSGPKSPLSRSNQGSDQSIGTGSRKKDGSSSLSSTEVASSADSVDGSLLKPAPRRAADAKIDSAAVKARLKQIIESKTVAIKTDLKLAATPPPPETVEQVDVHEGQLAKTESGLEPVALSLSSETLQRWKHVLYIYRLARQLARRASANIARMLSTIHHVSVSQEATVLASWYQKDLEYSHSLEGLTATRAKGRAGDLVKTLDKTLRQRFPEYTKFPEEERLHMCQLMTMERHRQDTAILWEEHTVSCFFFIVVGKLDIFKLHGNGKLPLLTLQGGHMLGHARAKIDGATRSACAVAATDVVLLRVDKGEFMRLLAGPSKESVRLTTVDERAFVLERSPVFAAHPELFKKISVFLEFSVWEKDEPILAQGDTINNFFWIVSGSCQVFKSLPFCCQQTAPGKSVVRSYGAGDVVGPDDKIVDIQMTTQDALAVGDWFPYVPIDLDDAMHFTDEKDAVYRYRIKHGSEYSVVADSTVITASVDFADFMFLASPAVVKTMIEQPRVFRYDTRHLQQAYLDLRAWEEHKKQTQCECGSSFGFQN